jgi:predicted house-cleaning NTP pyrophosphatase (Maf/HAM1 superfamily)
MFVEIQKAETEEERSKIIARRADKSKISKTLSGTNDDNLADAVCKHFAKMLGAETVHSVMSASDCSIVIARVDEKPKKSEVHVNITATVSNNQQRSVSAVVIMGKNNKICDIKIEGLSIIQALYTQIQSYVKNKYNKTLKQIDNKDRVRIVIEAINSIQGEPLDTPSNQQSKAKGQTKEKQKKAAQ